MKRCIYILILLLIIFSMPSCNDDNLDSESIFKETSSKHENKFDVWIKENYVDVYNIKVIYRMEDMESLLDYTLAPADFVKSQMLCKMIKHAWLECYDEVAGVDFTRKFVPKTIHLIGSAAYENNGTMILGTAEEGLKVTLYLVNNLTLDRDFLNEYFFHTMHHEFTHILNQNKAYDPNFDLISEKDYVSGDWYLMDEDEALEKGFIRPYASYSGREDFAELLSTYITLSDDEWNEKIENAGKTGAPIIEEKLEIIRKYMKDSWNIDLDELHSVVQRRLQETVDGDLDLTPIETLDD